MKRLLLSILAFAMCISLVACETVDSRNTSLQEPQETEDTNELILDKDGLQIYFTGFSAPPSPAKGYYINVRIENTSDIDYTIQVDNVSANDVAVPFGYYIFSPEVPAGKNLNDKIWIIGPEDIGLELPVTSAEFNFVLFTDGLNNREPMSTVSVSE